MTENVNDEVATIDLPEKAADQIAERSHQAMLALHECVEIAAKKLGGVPVFRGTRFSIPQFLAELGDCDDISEIADNFEIDESVLRKFLHALSLYLKQPTYQ